eukprot:6194965-Pleurochrysis_carterae.AAC.1
MYASQLNSRCEGLWCACCARAVAPSAARRPDASSALERASRALHAALSQMTKHAFIVVVF